MENIVIFGDSYSALWKNIPGEYTPFYPAFDVLNYEDMWFAKVINHLNGQLLRNDSWSGTTIGFTGYDNEDCSQTNSFIYRYRKLKEEGFFQHKEVDRIFVFGGTNDSWSNAPLGEMKFALWQAGRGFV